MAEHEVSEGKREYFAPKIVHTEKITTRAVSCSKENDANCGSGPVQS